jgi:hypothetical protein
MRLTWTSWKVIVVQPEPDAKGAAVLRGRRKTGTRFKLSRLVAAGLLSLPVIALLMFVTGSGGASASSIDDTWTGTWSRAEDNVSGVLILNESGKVVQGHYTWNDGSGHVSGVISGVTLDGTFNENRYRGSFSLTLSGTHFTGTYSGENKDTHAPISGPFDGACINGPCEHNGTSATIEQIPAPSSFDQVVSAPAPEPGGAATTESPPLDGSGDPTAPVSVDVSGLSVRDQLIYNARHDCYVQAVKALKGLAALRLVKQINAGLDTLEHHGGQVLSDLAACVATADALAKQLYSAQDARAACSELPIVLSLRGSGQNARLRSVRFGDRHSPLKVSCVRKPQGLRVTVAPRSKHVRLSSIVGSRLRIAIVRARTDRSGGQFSVAFHR